MKIIIFLMLCLILCGTAGATDYYVSVTGDNNASGDITHPWQNVSYATLQAVAGDSINLFNGTWYDEVVMFQNNGTPGAPIVLTAHNGTPTLQATVHTQTGIQMWYVGSFAPREHIDISNLVVNGYHMGIYIRKSNHVNVVNCTIGIPSKESGNHGGIGVYDGSSWVNIIGCTLEGDGWNSLGLSGRYVASGIWGQQPSHNISVIGNRVSNNTHHNLIDIKGNVTDVDIKHNIMHNCNYNGFYTHQGNPKKVNFSNNQILNVSLNGVSLYWGTDCILQNNTIHDCECGLRGYESINITYKDNTISKCLGNGIYHHNTSIAEGNKITDAGSMAYRFAVDMNILRSPILQVAGDRIHITAGGDVIIDNRDGQVFGITGVSGANYTYTPPKWYTNGGNASLITTGIDTVLLTITNYAVTVMPANAYHDVIVNHDSNLTDDRTNLTITSSTGVNPTWINATMQYPACNYSVAINGNIVAYKNSDADKVVRHQYTGSWGTPVTFEVMYAGTADHTRAYYNLQSPIWNHATDPTYYWWNRPLTGLDKLSSFRMEITTS